LFFFFLRRTSIDVDLFWLVSWQILPFLFCFLSFSECRRSFFTCLFLPVRPFLVVGVPTVVLRHSHRLFSLQAFSFFFFKTENRSPPILMWLHFQNGPLSSAFGTFLPFFCANFYFPSCATPGFRLHGTPKCLSFEPRHSFHRGWVASNSCAVIITWSYGWGRLQQFLWGFGGGGLVGRLSRELLRSFPEPPLPFLLGATFLSKTCPDNICPFFPTRFTWCDEGVYGLSGLHCRVFGPFFPSGRTVSPSLPAFLHRNRERSAPRPFPPLLLGSIPQNRERRPPSLPLTFLSPLPPPPFSLPVVF